MQMICTHCDHHWDYRGNSVYYACCPRCRKQTRVRPAPLVPKVKDGSWLTGSLDKVNSSESPQEENGVGG